MSVKISSFTKPSNSFSGNVLKLVTGSVLAQALGMLFIPVVTRFFAPEAFGIVAIFSSITGIIGTVVCLRYNVAVMIPESNEEAVNILGVCLLAVIFMTSLSALIIFLWSERIISLIHVSELKNYLWLIPVAIFLQGIFFALNSWNSRTKHFGRLSVAQIVSSLTSQVTKLTAGFAGFVSGGVLIGTSVFGSMIATAVLGGQILRDDKKFFLDHIRWRAIVNGCVRFWKFPIIDTWGILMNSISWQLPVLMLSSFFSPAIVGYYSLGFAVIKAPIDITAGALSQVFYQKACDEKNIKGNNGELVEKLMDNLIFVGLFPIMVLTVIGEELFAIIFGGRWFEAGRYMQILAPWVFFWFISSPLSTLFSVYERQGSALSVHSLILITRILSLYIGGLYQNVYLALGLFSGTGIIAYSFVAVWNIRLSHANYKKIILSFLKHTFYTLPFCLSLYAVKYILQLGTFTVLLLAVAMGILYLFVFKNKYYSIIKAVGIS